MSNNLDLVYVVETRSYRTLGQWTLRTVTSDVVKAREFAKTLMNGYEDIAVTEWVQLTDPGYTVISHQVDGHGNYVTSGSAA